MKQTMMLFVFMAFSSIFLACSSGATMTPPSEYVDTVVAAKTYAARVATDVQIFAEQTSSAAKTSPAQTASAAQTSAMQMASSVQTSAIQTSSAVQTSAIQTSSAVQTSVMQTLLAATVSAPTNDSALASPTWNPTTVVVSPETQPDNRTPFSSAPPTIPVSANMSPTNPPPTSVLPTVPPPTEKIPPGQLKKTGTPTSP